MKKKKKVLFIGSFKQKSKSGHVGGQMFACNSLVQSELQNIFEWTLIDTTANTNLTRSITIRSFYAAKRIIRAFYYIVFGQIDTVMAFCSSGFSFLEKGMILRFAKLFGKKTILAPRSGFLIDNINDSSRYYNKAKKIFKSTDIVICQGKFWKDFFQNKFHIKDNKLQIIHNWIETSQYENKSKPINQKLKILFLGWVEKNKGIWDLLEAIKIVQHENINLTIAGHGKEFEKLNHFIKDNKLDQIIKIKGWVHGDDKKKLLHDSDVLVLPSYKEGLPNSMLEAMASKCAVIVSDVGAVSDIIDDGYNGFLINPGQPTVIAKKIKCYIENRNLINIHSERAFKTVKEKNSFQTILPKFQAILT